MALTLKQARLLHDYSQREMAGFIGVCEDSYRRIEKIPNWRQFHRQKKLAKFWDSPMTKFFSAQTLV